MTTMNSGSCWWHQLININYLSSCPAYFSKVIPSSLLWFNRKKLILDFYFSVWTQNVHKCISLCPPQSHSYFWAVTTLSDKVCIYCFYDITFAFFTCFSFWFCKPWRWPFMLNFWNHPNFYTLILFNKGDSFNAWQKKFHIYAVVISHKFQNQKQLLVNPCLPILSVKCHHHQ